MSIPTLYGVMKRKQSASSASLILVSATALLLQSCKDSENYDTQPTPNYPSGGAGMNPAPHPTYGDAAYGDQPGVTETVAPPTVGNATETPVNPPNSVGMREHYVGPGDSLWKISRVYKVPVESIKQANGMTSDTVVLGKKIIIPAQ